MDGDSTISPGSQSQNPTILSLKKFLLTTDLNLLWCNLKPLPCVSSIVFWVNTLSQLQPPFKSYRVMTSPCSLLFSRLNSPNSLCHTLKLLFTRPSTSFIFSSLDRFKQLHILLVKIPNWAQYSKCRLTGVQSAVNNKHLQPFTCPLSGTQKEIRIVRQLLLFLTHDDQIWSPNCPISAMWWQSRWSPWSLLAPWSDWQACNFWVYPADGCH